jgi:hypothetical protein
MIMLENVLNKPTPPSKEKKWHIILSGNHPLELLAVLEIIAEYDEDVIQTAEWSTDGHGLLICLRWIDEVIPRFIQSDVDAINEKLHSTIQILENGRATCHGHNAEI